MLARELRKAAAREEVIVWKALRNKKFCNLKFKRQDVIEGFVIDYYCHKLYLVIEIDGKIHDKQKDYDKASAEPA